MLCRSWRRLKGEADSEDPVSSKGLLGVNLASAIASKKVFEGKTPLGRPLNWLSAALWSVLRSWWVCASQVQQHHLCSWSVIRPSHALAGAETLEIRWK